jgi:hypothetical protein
VPNFIRHRCHRPPPNYTLRRIVLGVVLVLAAITYLRGGG